MMGRNDKPQKPLFYAFNLDELVPQDHLLRKIDTFLDLSDLHEHLAPYYSLTDRSAGTLDRGTRWSGILCLLDQLRRHHHRCRSDPGASLAGSAIDQDHDRTGRGTHGAKALRMSSC